MRSLLRRLSRSSSAEKKDSISGPHFEVKQETPPASAPPNHIVGGKVEIGCGGQPREGYIGCDVRAEPGVDIVCNAWDVNRYCREMDAIYSRHTLEHLTWAEARFALDSIYDALAVGGEVELIVPNMDFHIEQWMRADWTDEAMADKWSDASWAMAGFYGWQRDCDPLQPGYERSYWDVHKSGYNEKVMTFFLKNAGFSDIETKIVDGCHLVATAKKRINSGERQVSASVGGIRADHVGRYELADRLLPGDCSILDAACGVGYGSSILAEGNSARRVRGVDLHEVSVAYAQENYLRDNLQFQVEDLSREDLDEKCFDAIVSFETIEHVEDAEKLLARFSQQVTPGGTLIVSTPNEELLPFDPEVFRYHVRHYSQQEFTDMLQRAGFRIDSWYCQNDRFSNVCEEGPEGLFMIAVCRKVAEN